MRHALADLQRVIALVSAEAARPVAMRTTEASDEGLAAALRDLGATVTWLETGAVGPLPDELDNLFYLVLDEWSPTSPVTDATLRAAFLVQESAERREQTSRDIQER